MLVLIDIVLTERSDAVSHQEEENRIMQEMYSIWGGRNQVKLDENYAVKYKLIFFSHF